MHCVVAFADGVVVLAQERLRGTRRTAWRTDMQPTIDTPTLIIAQPAAL